MASGSASEASHFRRSYGLAVDRLELGVGHAGALAEREIRDFVEREDGRRDGVRDLDTEEVGVLDIFEHERRTLIILFGANFDVVELDAFDVADIEAVRGHAVQGGWCRGRTTARRRGA